MRRINALDVILVLAAFGMIVLNTFTGIKHSDQLRSLRSEVTEIRRQADVDTEIQYTELMALHKAAALSAQHIAALEAEVAELRKATAPVVGATAKLAELRDDAQRWSDALADKAKALVH